MAEAIATTLCLQIVGQALFEFPKVFKRTLKLVKKLRRAKDDAQQFVEDCYSQHKFISQIIKEIELRFPSASRKWICMVRKIGQQADGLVNSISQIINDVLQERGVTWRAKWASKMDTCKEAYEKLVALGTELMKIEAGMKLSEENGNARRQKHKDPIATGAKVGAARGVVLGIAIGAYVATSALNGAAVGGPVGLVVGACFGAFVGWCCS